jgi:hypothetical protein
MRPPRPKLRGGATNWRTRRVVPGGPPVGAGPRVRRILIGSLRPAAEREPGIP